MEDLSRDDTLTLVTTRAVAFGEELLVDYGADFEWKFVQKARAGTGRSSPQAFDR